MLLAFSFMFVFPQFPYDFRICTNLDFKFIVFLFNVHVFDCVLFYERIKFNDFLLKFIFALMLKVKKTFNPLNLLIC